MDAYIIIIFITLSLGYWIKIRKKSELSNMSTVVDRDYPSSVEEVLPIKEAKYYNSNNPKKYTWDTPHDLYDYNFENDLIKVTFMYGADQHGASFYTLRIVDKKRKKDYYFTDTWYIKSDIKMIADKSFENLIIREYLRGQYCINLKDGMISKCFDEDRKSELDEILEESVTVQSGEIYFLSRSAQEVRSCSVD